MARCFSFLLWTGVFLLILLAVDQLLVRVPASMPAHVAVATFYRDLRGRVLNLATGKTVAPAKTAALPPKSTPSVSTKATSPPASIEAIIDQRERKKTAVSPVPVKSAGARPAVAPPVPAVKPEEPVEAPVSIEAVIDQRQSSSTVTPSKAKPALTPPAGGGSVRRYLYADEQGNLHFADTLSEVPERYRDKVKLVGE